MIAGVIALGAGLIIGLLYALLTVRSPAPPAIALIGLLGMLAGEQAVQALKTPPEAHAAQSRDASASGYTRTG